MLIPSNRSIIPACDVFEIKEFEQLVKQTCGIKGIGAYKVGLELTIRYGLKRLVDVAREHTNLPIIYDHQKAATDIPDMGSKFAKACKSSGVDAVILFPFGGAATEIDWIKACQDTELPVLVGGHMTQKKFLASEGGFIADDGPERIYEIAAEAGVRDFVVPGNKTELVIKYRSFFESLKILFSLYAPGFVTQGGVITQCGKAAGERWHAIVGSGIYKADNIKEAAEVYARQILN